MTKQFFPTRRERDCMVTIHENSSREFPIRLSEIAKIMGMKPPTVIEILKRLESKGLITREKGMVILTDAGKESYNFITNCHRILETIFVDSGIDLEERGVKKDNILYINFENERLIGLNAKDLDLLLVAHKELFSPNSVSPHNILKENSIEI